MKYTLDQRTHLNELLAREHAGPFNEAPIIEEYAGFLREEAQAGRINGIVGELARSAVKAAIKERTWEAQEDAPLFDADALMALGDGEHVRMADARAEHLLRHDSILTENFERQSHAYFLKHGYISERLPDLYSRGCTLGDIETG